MKKVLFLVVVLFFALTTAVFANRAEIDEAIESYEAVVVEAESLAEKPLVDANDFSAIDEKAKDAGAKIEAVVNETEWMIEDARRAAELRARFNEAMAVVIQKLLKY